MAAALTAEQIDVFSSDVYLGGIPHEQFAWLRAQPGMLRQRIEDPQLEREAFIAARYADVLEVSKDAEHFTIEYGHNVRKSRGTRAQGANLLTMDDPDHLQARMRSNRAFTPKVIRRHAEHYRALANSILDTALPQGEIDFVTEVSMKLPLAAICEMLGAPREDYDRIIEWSNRIIGTEDGEYGGSAENRWEAFAEFSAYCDGLVMRKLANPVDDLMTALAQQQQAGEMTSDELSGYLLLLFVAGNETTRNNISHGVRTLTEHPDQMAMLRAAPLDSALWDTATEEITRWATPVIYMSRTCTKATSVNGQAVEPGDVVAMFYPSANRDEAVFGPTANRFDITRDPNPHLSFGFSTHFCLGAHLAKLETKVMLQELVRRVEQIEIIGEPQLMRGSFIHGMKHLPVRVHAP